MSEQLKAFRLAGLEEWRTRSFSLGGPLGHLFTRTFEVIQTVVRDGIENEVSLPYALESLGRERDHAMSRDEQREEPIRQLVYGLSDAVKTLIDAVREAKGGGGDTGGGGGAIGGGGGARPGMGALIKEIGGIRAGAVVKEQRRIRTGSSAVSGAAVAVREQVIRQESVGGARQQSVGGVRQASVVGASQSVGGATVVADQHLEEEAPPQDEEWNSSSSDSLPLFSALLIKREQQDSIANEHVSSTFDVNDFGGATRPYEEANQPISNFTLKRALSEDPTSFQTPLPAKQRYFPSAALAAASDPSRPHVVLHGCDLCDRFFESERGLVRHAFTHSAARCPACRKFVSKDKLKKHMKEKHAGRRAGRPKRNAWDEESEDEEEPVARQERAATLAPSTLAADAGGRYACDRCDKSFSSLVGLHRHAYVHDAVACPICARPLSKHRLDIHMKDVHKEHYREFARQRTGSVLL